MEEKQKGKDQESSVGTITGKDLAGLWSHDSSLHLSWGSGLPDELVQPGRLFVQECHQRMKRTV